MKSRGPTKEEARARAAQWALSRYNSNKNSRLAKYQLRNINKAVEVGKDTAASKAANLSKKMSTKDVDRLIAITDEAKLFYKSIISILNQFYFIAQLMRTRIPLIEEENYFKTIKIRTV